MRYTMSHIETHLELLRKAQLVFGRQASHTAATTPSPMARVSNDDTSCESITHLGPDDDFDGGVEWQFVRAHGNARVFAGVAKCLDEQF